MFKKPRLFLYFILFCRILTGSSVQAGNIDFEFFKDKYPDNSTITLSNEVTVTYFFEEDSGVLKAKSNHKIAILALEDGAKELELIQLPFSSFTEVNIISARYYLLDSLGEKKIREKVKVKYAEVKDYFIDGIFYNDLKVKQFTSRRGVFEKSVLVYEYEIIYHDLKFLTKFMALYPNEVVEHFSFIVKHPDKVKVEVKQFNIDPNIWQIENKTNNGMIEKQFEIYNLHIAVHDYNLPPSYYLPHFILLTRNYEKNGEIVNLLNSVDDMYAWYSTLVNELDPDDEKIRLLVNDLIQNKKTEVDKIESIFQWVQENINYVAFEDGLAGFKPEEADLVIDKKYGDCKGMANLLVVLLKAAEIPAYHTWIGTRRLPYDYSFPSLAVDNHMICAVEYENGYYFLDATDKIAKWDYPPSHIEGKSALIGKGDSYEIVKVPVTNAERNSVKIVATIRINKNSIADIQGKIYLTGLERSIYLNWYKHASLQKKSEAHQLVPSQFFENFNSTLEDSPWLIVDVLEIDFKGIITGNFVMSKDMFYLYCEPGESTAGIDNAANLPIFINNKHITSYDITYVLSNNLALVSVPDNITITSENKQSSYTASFVQQANTINFKSAFEINQLFIPSKEIRDWETMASLRNRFIATPIIFKTK